ncbi:MAG: outer membrane lipoprotein carrier protein LolA [Myxococcaceae bacterium]|nr:outer membrane lipoprotein carrier protein LolA [Myxococcaceae bacterium]MBH2006813.1 outer membrane lipoprotein carrier protein LolA [Myxococcaceae bacterium]
MLIRIASCLLCLPILANAAALAKIQALYDRTHAFQADFQQTYRNKLFNRTEHSTGEVRYQRLGKMRWDYRSPHAKSFILNGKKLWLVEPSEKTVSINRCFKSDTLSQSLIFLGGEGRLAREFKLLSASKNQLVLVPKQKTELFEKLILSFEAKTYQISRVILIDVDGNQNEFVFSNRRFNRRLPAPAFDYKTPPGFEEVNLASDC